MLSYISQKFEKPTRSFSHEPRAALFLNRFSRTLTIMYATNGLADALGISSNELCGKSFYYCIQENCLREAVKCLESAKANDSIAYLRFWFRDPRQDGHTDQDEHMSDGHSSGDEDDGGVHLSELMEHEGSENAVYSDSSNAMRSSVVADNGRNGSLDPNSRTSSGDSTDMGGNSSDAIFDQRSGNQQSRTSSISTPDQTPSEENPWSREPSQIELEAVVSCTSDGLVVVLRRAKPFLPQMSQATSDNVQHPYANGYFASPWAADPILPDEHSYSHQALPHLQPPSQPSLHPTASRSQLAATKGPATEDFMNSIREVAVFAWSLTGINGSLEQYARGTPSGESQPPGGLPIWDPHGNAGTEIYRPLGGVYTTDDYGQPYPSQKKIGYPDSRSVDHTNYTAGDLASNGNLAHTYNSGAYAQSHSNGNVDHTYDQRQHQDNGFSNGYSNGLNATNGDAFESSNGYGVGSGAHDHHSNGQSNGTWSPQFQQHQGWDASHHPGNGSNGHMTNNEARGYG